MVKLCIFDMDGLLIDSERVMWIPNELKALSLLGYEADVDFLCTLMGGTRQTSEAKFYEKYGNDFNIDKFYEIVLAQNEKDVNEGKVPLRKGALNIIQFLKANNIDFCLGTSADREYTTKALKANNVLDEFKYIVTRDDVKKAKPNPDIYLKCMSLFNYKPDEIVVLEDAHNGSLAAIGAGCRCIMVKDLALLTDWDYKNCEAIVNSLDEVIDIIKKENETTISV